jgi:hypothetical protein
MRNRIGTNQKGTTVPWKWKLKKVTQRLVVDMDLE